MNHRLLKAIAGSAVLILLLPLLLLFVHIWMGMFLPDPLPMMAAFLTMIASFIVLLNWVLQKD